MKCKTVDKKIIFFLEGKLPTGEMEQVRLHLSKCDDCAAFAEEIKKTFAFLESEKSPAVNPFFYTRLKAKMENRESAKKQVFGMPAFVRILQPAMFSVLLIIGIYAGIKIGQPVSKQQYTATIMQNEVIPYLNEMEVEAFETSLME